VISNPSVPTPTLPNAAASAPSISTLQIGHGWHPEEAGSGLDRVYFSLLQHLPQVGVQVRGLVAGNGTAPAAPTIVSACRPDAALASRLWSFYRASRRLTATHPIDLVAAHFPLFTLPALPTFDVPLVTHFHGPWAAESRVEGGHALTVALKRWVERRVYRSTDRFIVLSKAFRDVLRTEFGVSPACISIVPGGVDLDRFRPSLTPDEARRRLGWPTDRPLLLSVRRLVRRVGLERLVTALDQVRRDCPDVLLLIAGRGPLETTLRAQIQERGLEDHVQLLGFVPDPDLPLAYRAATLSVVPTVALEGFGLVAVESLASGTPPIVTPVGGLPEIVAPLSDALIMPSAVPDQMAAHIVDLLRGRLPVPDAEACTAYADAHYGWPAVAHNTRTVYEEVLR
jgi:glycosyltransferase involved in cell wall biosynthesis